MWEIMERPLPVTFSVASFFCLSHQSLFVGSIQQWHTTPLMHGCEVGRERIETESEAQALRST